LTACLLASLFVSLRLRTLAIATPDLPAAQSLSLQSDNPGA